MRILGTGTTDRENIYMFVYCYKNVEMLLELNHKIMLLVTDIFSVLTNHTS